MDSTQELVENEKNDSKFTKYQKKCLTCILTVGFFSYSTMSLISPFFPKKASEIGLNTAQSGFVFSIYAISCVFFSPILGKVASFGPKKVMLFGIFCNGLANILFGFSGSFKNKNSFFYACLLLRIFEAFGTISHITSAYIYVIKVFPKHISFAFGLTETFSGIGLSIGPAIGGLIYSYGGYSLPFYIFGSLILSCIPITYFVINELDDHEISKKNEKESNLMKNENNIKKTKSISFTKLLFKQKVLINSFVIIFMGISSSFIFPSLEEYMSTFQATMNMVSLEFFIAAGVYVTSTVFVGKLLGETKYQFTCMLFGVILTVLSFIIIGPSRILTFMKPGFFCITLGLILSSLGGGFALIPTFECYSRSCSEYGLEDNLDTNSKISSLWSCLYSFGEAIGPLLSGYMLTYFSFPDASTYTALGIAVIIPALFVMMIKELRDINKKNEILLETGN